MTDRRSSRSKKTVDYSKFAGGESDNDDDFRESSTQSTKRKKNESSPPKSVKVKLTKVDTGSYKVDAKKTEKQPKNNEDSAPKKRPSLSDKVFQRHLSEALEISKQEDSEAVSSENENENSLLLNEQKKTENDETEVDHPVTNDVNSGANCKMVCEEEPRRNKSKDDDEWDDASSSENEEESDASDWSDEDKETKVRKPAVKSRNSKNNKDEGDESDWSDDDDDDGKKKSKKPTVKKGEPKKQSKKMLSPKTPQPPKPMTPRSSKPSKKIPGNSTVSPGLKPSVKSPGTPCQVISSPVKLPPKGIRIGLSRKVSGKPLHSVIKAQH